MGCRLYFFLYFCTATNLGRSPQLLLVHSFSSWLSLIRYLSLVPSYLFCLNLLFDGGPTYQRLLTRSNSLIWASPPNEWHTSLSSLTASQRVKNYNLKGEKSTFEKQIWKKKKQLLLICCCFCKTNLKEEKQLLFFFSCLTLFLYSHCPLRYLRFRYFTKMYLIKSKSSVWLFAIGIRNHQKFPLRHDFGLQSEIATGYTETLEHILPGMQNFQKMNSTLQVQNITSGYL